MGLAVSLIPILLRVLPPLAKDAATNERDREEIELAAHEILQYLDQKSAS